ncbi:MAG: serine/threonine protein kinase [Phycisphaera sp.]|nr:MAG: serine/threonine protein kinase [Phycisphaera sp.]
MSDTVFEAFDRLVDEPEASWAKLASDIFPNEAERRSELLQMLRSWKGRPEFRVRTQDLQEAIHSIRNETSDNQPTPDIEGLEILEELGTGGSGTVYKCRQLRAGNRVVAVKVFSQGTGRVNHVLREATALSRLNHPHIATLYSVGTARDGRAYVLLEYVEGLSLTHYLESVKPELAHTVDLMIQICDAVAYANEAGVIHRDLKPSNIMVKQDSGSVIVKVLDFSISRSLTVEEEQAINSETLVAGTPEYMSPEQVDPGLGPCTTRSDVFSLGTVFYEILAGVHPYLDSDTERPSLLSILQAVRDTDPIEPSVARAKHFRTHKYYRWGNWSDRALKGDLDAIVLRANTALPSDRYPNVRDLLDDIYRYKSSLPVRARRLTALNRLRRTAARHPIVTAWVGLLLVSVISVAGLSFWGYQRELGASKREALAHSDTRMAFASSALVRDDLQLARHQLDRIPAEYRTNTWLVISRFIDQSESSVLLDSQGIADIHVSEESIYIAGRSGRVWTANKLSKQPEYQLAIDRSGKVMQVVSTINNDFIYILNGDAVEVWHEGTLVQVIDLPQEHINSQIILSVELSQEKVLLRDEAETYVLDMADSKFKLSQQSDVEYLGIHENDAWGFDQQKRLTYIGQEDKNQIISLRGHSHSGIVEVLATDDSAVGLISGDSAGHVKIWRVPTDVLRLTSASYNYGAVDSGWVWTAANNATIGALSTQLGYEIDPFSCWTVNAGIGALLRILPESSELIYQSPEQEVVSAVLPRLPPMTAKPAYCERTSTLWLAESGSTLTTYNVSTGYSQSIELDESPITAITPDQAGGVVVAVGRSLRYINQDGYPSELCQCPLGTQFIDLDDDVIVACETRGKGIVLSREQGAVVAIDYGNDIRDIAILHGLGLIAVGRGDGSIGLFDIKTNTETASLPLYDNPVRSIHFGSDAILRSSSSESEAHWLDLSQH